MQKHEFETLTGMMVDEPTFSHAEDIYLAAGAMTKEQVCREIKDHPFLLESEVVSEIASEFQEQRRLAAKRLVNIEKLKAALLNAALIADDKVVWNGAKELIGPAAVISFKVASECTLDSDDIAYITENLK